jgi:hypothetical protein
MPRSIPEKDLQMRSPKLFVPALALTALVALGGTALAANDTAAPSEDRVAAEPAPATSALAREYEGPGTDTAPREYEGPGTDTAPTAREIAEPYEGPGTTAGPVHTCLLLDGREVCDTFGETDEGPGTR